MKHWVAHMQVTYLVDVSVSARTAKEAEAKANAGLWYDEDITRVVEWQPAASIEAKP